MKIRTICIAIALAGIAGAASAAGEQQKVMQPVTVSAARIADCTPPNGSTGHACDAFNQFIRANFTEREIGVLFGDRTSYPEYAAGGFDRLQQRYDTLLHQYIAAQRSVNASSVASR